MVKILLSVLLCLTYLSAAAGIGDNIWFPIKSVDPKPVECSLVSGNEAETIISVSVNGYYLKDIIINGQITKILRAHKTTPILEKGSPDLTKLSIPILLPATNGMTAEIVSSSFIDIENIDMAPSKGNLTRDINPAEVPYQKGSVYLENLFYPGKLAEMKGNPYLLHDKRGQALWIYPFQYNAITKTLRIYSDITLRLYDNGLYAPNPLPASLSHKQSAEFNAICARHFFNFPSELKYNTIPEEGEMLIISYGPYMTEMAPFIAWKKQCGINTTMVDIADIGNTETDIKQFVQNYYNTHNLAFLLLVGDHEMVPSSWSTIANGSSDVSYGFTAGDDHYPDVLVGRFSGENTTHIRTQVQKVIHYEKLATTDQSFYAHAAFIASDQGEGIGDDGQIDWEHARGIRSQLMDFTYNTGYEFYDGSQNGEDDPGNPNAQDVVDVVLNGTGVMWYTGHGFEQGCSTSGISSSEVESLSNVGKLPFFWSVACVNGNFAGITCFAESWLRATYNDQPSGAMATLMSSINQAWAPPMEGQDEMANILTEASLNNIKRTFGGISFNGCASMNDAYGVDGYEMTDSWNCFGDPSFVVRTKTPEIMTASAPASLPIGASFLSVLCDVEGAKASLVINDQLISAGIVTNGSANLEFSPLAGIEEGIITVTAFNKIPVITTLTVFPSNNPFITLHQNQINSIFGGNGNDIAEYNEALDLGIIAENLGMLGSTGIVATLSENSEFVSVTSGSIIVGDLSAGEDITLLNAFQIVIAPDVPDQTLVTFDLTFTDSNGNSWTSHPTLLLQAPLLEAISLAIDDIDGGNGNHRLDPGETVELAVEVVNNGHSSTPPCLGQLSTSSSYLAIITDLDALGTLTPDGSAFTANFTAIVSPTIPAGTEVDFLFETASNSAYDITATYHTTANLVVEDFASGGFTQFDWTNDTTIPWVIDHSTTYEGSESARSGAISDSESTALTLTLDVAEEGEISFYKKVSSEQDYDYLIFYIDDVQLAAWSGEVEWSESVFNISPGMHTFKWVYVKDVYVDSGADAAWLDFISLPPMVVPNACVASAGSLQVVGETTITTGQNIGITAQNYNTAHTEMFLLTTLGPAYNIVDIKTDPVAIFTPSEPGNYLLGALNYDPANPPSLPTIGQSALSISGGCFDLKLLGSTGIAISVVTPTTIQHIPMINHWALSPVPAKNYVDLSLFKNTAGPVQLELFDLTGRLIYDYTFDAEAGEIMHTLFLGDYAKGIYLLNIRTENRLMSGRIIKE